MRGARTRTILYSRKTDSVPEPHWTIPCTRGDPDKLGTIYPQLPQLELADPFIKMKAEDIPFSLSDYIHYVDDTRELISIEDTELETMSQKLVRHLPTNLSKCLNDAHVPVYEYVHDVQSFAMSVT